VSSGKSGTDAGPAAAVSASTAVGSKQTMRNWETLVLFAVNLSRLDVMVNMSNVMGNTMYVLVCSNVLGHGIVLHRSYDTTGLRTVWHLEKTTRPSTKILGKALGGAGHYEHGALSFWCLDCCNGSVSMGGAMTRQVQWSRIERLS